MRPFFSIIIPTLNEEKFIPQLLTDLTKQREQDFEVIVIDANSRDETKKQVLKFKNKLALQFFEVRKRNVSYQRNYGAKRAKGSFLIFHDADTRLSSVFTQKLKKVIEKQKGLLFLFFLEPGDVNVQNRAIFNVVNFFIESSQNSRKPFSSSGSVGIEKNFFNLIGGYDTTLFVAEDHNLIQKGLQWGVKAKFLRNIRVKFSLRRLKKEGRLTLLYKYLIAMSHMYTKGDIREKIYEYEMGGHVYGSARKKPARAPYKKSRKLS